MQMIAPQGHAALGRPGRSAPLVHEDARSAPRNGFGPIPVGDKHEVVERIGAAQALTGAAVGGGDLEVVVRHGGVVRPEVAEADGNRPGAGRRDAVRAVEHANDAVLASGGGAVALLLGDADAAAADDAGVAAFMKPSACGGNCKILRCHEVAYYIMTQGLRSPTSIVYRSTLGIQSRIRIEQT